MESENIKTIFIVVIMAFLMLANAIAYGQGSEENEKKQAVILQDG